jgi:hypothetical protein
MLTKSLIALSLALTLGNLSIAGAASHHSRSARTGASQGHATARVSNTKPEYTRSVRPDGSQGYASTRIPEPEYMRYQTCGEIESNGGRCW